MNLLVNSIGEPDAANLHVRFDERGAETERWSGLRHRRWAKAAGHSKSPDLRRPRCSSTLPRQPHARMTESGGKVKDNRPNIVKLPAGHYTSLIGSNEGLYLSSILHIAKNRGRPHFLKCGRIIVYVSILVAALRSVALGAALGLYETGAPDLGTASAGRAAMAADASTGAANPAGMTLLDRSQLLWASGVLLPSVDFDSCPGNDNRGQWRRQRRGVYARRGVLLRPQVLRARMARRSGLFRLRSCWKLRAKSGLDAIT